MKFADLEPELVRHVAVDRYERVSSLADAHGVLFLCPACFVANGGNVGTHSILTWFRDRGVPANTSPGLARWVVTGSGLGDLTLMPSVHLSGPGCGWHGWIRAGEVTTC